MKIIKCNGLDPSATLAQPNFRYVGRFIALRSGKYARQSWPASPLASPFKLGKVDDPVRKYAAWLLQQIDEQEQAVLSALKEIRAGSILGCWCLEASDDPAMLLPPIHLPGHERCHAEVIANVWHEWSSKQS